MRILSVRNVCEALPAGLRLLQEEGRKEISRAGDVLVMPCPVMTVTEKPQERVLFSEARDANPFFHLFESIWMLAGRIDAAPLTDFVRTFAPLYAEPDGNIHGAYGYRWRKHLGFDQLSYVCDKLSNLPNSRQCVLQMWDGSECILPKEKDHDLQFGAEDLRGDWKDRPCNTHVYLRILDGKLDITVCCRSNDAIWGTHGANAVHFSVLQEYLAARLKLEVGTMYQLSNNYHAYISELDKLERRRAQYNDLCNDRYGDEVVPLQMFTHWDTDSIDEDIELFMNRYDARELYDYTNFKNDWFRETLLVAMLAHSAFKNMNRKRALALVEQIAAPDWRIACYEWMMRRCNDSSS